MPQAEATETTAELGYWLAGMRDFVDVWRSRIDQTAVRIGRWANVEDARRGVVDTISSMAVLTETAGRYAAHYASPSPRRSLPDVALDGSRNLFGNVQRLPNYSIEHWHDILGYGSYEYVGSVGYGRMEQDLREIALLNAAQAKRTVGLAAHWYDQLNFRRAWHRIKHHGGFGILEPEEPSASGAPPHTLDRLVLVAVDAAKPAGEQLLLPCGDHVLRQTLRVAHSVSNVLVEMFLQRLYAAKVNSTSMPPPQPFPGVRCAANVDAWQDHLKSLPPLDLAYSGEGHDLSHVVAWLNEVERPITGTGARD